MFVCIIIILYLKIVNKNWNTHAPDDDCGLGEPWNDVQLEYINNVFKTEKSFINLINCVFNDTIATELQDIFGEANFSNLRNKYKKNKSMMNIFK